MCIFELASQKADVLSTGAVRHLDARADVSLSLDSPWKKMLYAFPRLISQLES